MLRSCRARAPESDVPLCRCLSCSVGDDASAMLLIASHLHRSEPRSRWYCARASRVVEGTHRLRVAASGRPNEANVDSSITCVDPLTKSCAHTTRRQNCNPHRTSAGEQRTCTVFTRRRCSSLIARSRRGFGKCKSACSTKASAGVEMADDRPTTYGSHSPLPAEM
jgi:hypothetical protein